MMKKADLPVGSRIGKFFIQPLQLFGIQIIAVEGEEANVAFLKGIVLLAIHAEEFIKALIGIVVITERGIELDAGIHQRLVGNFELLLHVSRSVSAVDV